MIRNIKIQIIISLNLIILMSLIGFYAIKTDLDCKKSELNLFQNKIICERFEGREIDGKYIEEAVYTIKEISVVHLLGIYLIPFVFFSAFITSLTFYFCFFRFRHFSSISDSIGNFYNLTCENDIKKESYFLGTFLFIYLLVLIGIWLLIGFMFSVNYKNLMSIWTYLQMLIYSVSVTVPIAISIYFSKKWINSQTPKKAFLKSPLSTIIPSIFFVIFITFFLSIYAGVNLTGESRLLPLVWLFISPAYIIGIALTSLLLTSYIYHYRQQKNRMVLRLIMVFLLCAPYLITLISAMI